MRFILCETCGQPYEEGRYTRIPSGHTGPADWLRVVWGTARLPTPPRLIVTAMSGKPIAFDVNGWLCEACDREIPEGAPIMAVSSWTPGARFQSEEPEPWEDAYLTPRVAS